MGKREVAVRRIKMPPVLCYICGRQFGTKSIKIHIPNCEERWEIEQAKLPKSERRPVPQAPDSFDRVIRGEVKGDQLQEYNTNAFKDFNEKALSECPNCHRTFLPRPLEIHLRSCKPKSAASTSAGSPNREKKAGARKYKPPRLKKKVVLDGRSAGDEENNPKISDTPSKADLVREIEENPVLNALEARIKLMNFITDLSLN